MASSASSVPSCSCGEVGPRLLVRGRRGVSLTPAGRRFLPRAIAAMDSLRRGATEAKAGSEARGGLLAVGLASDLALYLAPRALARFASRHPAVETLVPSGPSPVLAHAPPSRGGEGGPVG